MSGHHNGAASRAVARVPTTARSDVMPKMASSQSGGRAPSRVAAPSIVSAPVAHQAPRAPATAAPTAAGSTRRVVIRPHATMRRRFRERHAPTVDTLKLLISDDGVDLYLLTFDGR